MSQSLTGGQSFLENSQFFFQIFSGIIRISNFLQLQFTEDGTQLWTN